MSESKIALSIHELDERIVNLRAHAARIMEEATKHASKVEDEALQLEALKALALEIGRPINDEPPAFGRLGEPTADMIEDILRRHVEPLHIDEITRLLKEAGWKGSGNAKKDYKNIHTNLSTKPKRFQSPKRGYFGLAEENKS
jgi:hypothetical protein